MWLCLDALASPNSTPGGGTAADIAAATGAALLIMVASLTKTRNGTAAEAAALGEVKTALVRIRARLFALAEVDAEAFSQVRAAYRLPKTTDAVPGGSGGGRGPGMEGLRTQFRQLGF